MHPDRDPYAPPPAHHDKSGAVVRFLILGALVGAAAFGYMQFANSPQTADLTPPAEEQTLADTSMDQGYAPLPAPETTAPVQQAPASPAPAAAPAAQPSEPLPPPTTTTEQPPA